jgi:hypothetical protein
VSPAAGGSSLQHPQSREAAESAQGLAWIRKKNKSKHMATSSLPKISLRIEATKRRWLRP